jgi:hypothetical protein
MEDFSTTRIEPATPSVDLDKRPPSDGSPRKRPKPEQNKESSLPPIVDPGDPIEEIHQIDELA